MASSGRLSRGQLQPLNINNCGLLFFPKVIGNLVTRVAKPSWPGWRSAQSLQTHHMYSTLKRRGSDRCVWPGSLSILNESLTYWARLLNLLLAILCFFFASRLHLADILFVSPCLKMCFCYFLSLKNSFFRNSEHSTTLILIYKANQIEKKNSRILIFLICFVFSSPNPGTSPLGISLEITSYNWWHKPPLIGL